MSETYVGDAVEVIDQFEADRLSVEEAQRRLQSILTVWAHRSNDEEYDAIDLAESRLEEILFARVLNEQRTEASTRLGELKLSLVGQSGRSHPA